MKHNWITFLRRAADTTQPPITYIQWREVYHLAGRWPTCACGQLCKSLPRFYMADLAEDDDAVLGAPKDKALRNLGMNFFNAIGAENPRMALRIFFRIEARTAKLLAKQRKSK